jgi:hypothetical protein
MEKRPAEELAVGDRLLLRGQVWRVKGRRQNHVSKRITFDLWPCAGGRPCVEQFFPRQWVLYSKETRR